MGEDFENKFLKYIKDNNLKSEQIFFDNLVDHKENVLKTIKEKDIDFKDIVKTIVFINLDETLEYGNGVIAIVSAELRVNKEKLKEICKKRIKIASSDQVLILTSYPAGGVPPFGFKGDFYIDKTLLRKDIVYAGGGSLRTLVKTSIKEILKSNNAKHVNIL